jgi:ribonuclease HI
MFRKNTIYIYADGSSLPKPRRGGIGIRYVYLDESENEVRIDLDETGNESGTNNQMELKAVIIGIKKLYQQNIPIKYNHIEVRTDSKYVTDNKNNAIYYWSKNKWKNRNGRPVENSLLWKELIRQIGKINCKIEFVWVKGHFKDIDNKAADILAKDSAKSILDSPIVPIKVRRKKSSKKTKIGSIEMKGQRIKIHIITEEYMKLPRLSKYRYEVISRRSKYYGYVDFIFSELHHLKAGHKYLVTLNTDTNNPRILKMIQEID